ncbi:hypothetical protein I6E43_15925 [Fusobacterium varium]|jgi:hypothetical protein|nr:hypothetical protein [Fusobacterium varium]MCF2674866.1 hypothetical protein [Fusobacterium varium]UYI78850.1 MAG: hypothetical protein OGM09_01105 [Fusobacterium varium]DAE74112.1 MAG TPA: hypothetical protein [Caudoviricetes sp.]
MKNEKTLAVRILSGDVFYGKINKDGTVSERADDIPKEMFENAMLLYLNDVSKTDSFKKPYVIDLPQYKSKFRITVERLPREVKQNDKERVS